MHPSRPDQCWQIQLSNAQTMVLMGDMWRRIVMKTKGAVGNPMLPVAIVPSQSLGEVLSEHAPCPPTSRRKTSERVSHAASITCIPIHPSFALAHWVDGPIAEATSRTSLGGGAHARPIPLIEAILCLSAQAAVAFERYRFNKGLVVGATLAAVSCYDDRARRMGLRPSQMQLMLVATTAAAVTMFVQPVQVLCAFIHF
jgi:hypothetical protein